MSSSLSIAFGTYLLLLSTKKARNAVRANIELLKAYLTWSETYVADANASQAGK